MFNFAQLALPLIQAPMAGGITTPQLVAAVANHGGVGSFGFAYSTPEKIHADLVAPKEIICKLGLFPLRSVMDRDPVVTSGVKE